MEDVYVFICEFNSVLMNLFYMLILMDQTRNRRPGEKALVSLPSIIQVTDRCIVAGIAHLSWIVGTLDVSNGVLIAPEIVIDC